MPLFEFEGKHPSVHPEAFVAATATLIGDVTIEAGASIWYGAVLRGDCGPIIVRANANVQDNAVVHSPPEVTTEIGEGATIAHCCVIHGAVIGAETIIGNGTTVQDMATVGAGTMVAAHSLVGPGSKIPGGVLAAGAPAEVKRPVDGTQAEVWVRLNPSYYTGLAQRHRHGATEIGSGSSAPATDQPQA